MKEQKKASYTMDDAYKDIEKAEKALEFLNKEIGTDTEDEYDKEMKVHIEGLIKSYKELVDRIRSKERLEQYQKKKFEKETKNWEGITSMEDL